jgi:putative membrane protein
MVNYDPHNWFDHFFDIRGSLLKEIAGRITLCTVWSILIVGFHFNFKQVGIPSTIHSLVGLALGLLLVFRTNASYDRFWEGRKLWGGIVNKTRNLIRASEAYLVQAPEVRKELAQWTIAFPYAAMNVLRGTRDLEGILKEVESSKKIEVIHSPHLALAITRQMSLVLQRAKSNGLIGDYIQVALDQNIQLLVDYLGGCERIQKTPLPFAYVVHLRRALIFYCFSLPFALVESFGWITVIDTLLVAFVFFGIEEIGVEIEGPFGNDENDLPLEQICKNIEDNIKSLLTPSTGM